jgi:Ca-activated chloride channel family protein
LAEQAGGRFYNTTDSQNVPQIFAKETAMAGKTFIQDTPFTPVVERAGDLRSVFDQGLPPINAQIATTAKETADTVLAHPEGEPLLARWQYGLGRTAAWTSDAKGVWSNQWAAWSGSSPFWNQLLTWLLPQYKGGALDLHAGISGGAGELEVTLKEELPEGVTLKAEVIDGDLKREEVPLSLRAPGRYAGSFRADKPGTYMIAVRMEADGEVLQAASTGVSVSYSPEYAMPKNGRAVLEAIAAAGGGEVLSEPEAAFADNLAGRWRTRDLSLLFLLLAACLWPLDVGLRRVRIPLEKLSVRRVSVWRRVKPKLQETPSSTLQHLKINIRSAREGRDLSPPTTAPNSNLSPPAVSAPTPAQQTEDGANIASRLLEKKRKR